jgi:hypothetical protein
MTKSPSCRRLLDAVFRVIDRTVFFVLFLLDLQSRRISCMWLQLLQRSHRQWDDEDAEEEEVKQSWEEEDKPKPVSSCKCPKRSIVVVAV